MARTNQEKPAMTDWTLATINALMMRHALVVKVMAARPLTGGFWNTVLHLTTDQGDLVFKHYRPMPDNSLFLNLPADEAMALDRLKGLNVAPDLVAFVPAEDVLIYRFLPGPEWQNDVVAAALLMRRQSHADPTGFRRVPTTAPAILAEADQILSRCTEDATTRQLRQCRPVPQQHAAGPTCLIHTDAAPANMIGHGANLRLIDWQCPAAGDLAQDVATLFSPAFLTLYDRPLLSIRQRHLFLQTLDDPDLSERLSAVEPAYAWRLACYCAHRMQTTADADLALRYRRAALAQSQQE